jgi:branched-chain amino acid transport system substrate-binding protein
MSAKRYLIAFVVLSLLLLLIPACGGEGDNTTPTFTATPMSTSTATTTTSTSTPTPTPNALPVKIGAVSSWSGPAAVAGTAYIDPVIKFTEKTVNDAGGILGGRPIKFVKYDNRASVAEASAGAKKLVVEDKVSVLCFGGVSAGEFAAMADAAEETKVPYICLSAFPGIEGENFAVSSAPAASTLTSGIVDLVNGVLKPKTVAFIQMQETMRIERAKAQSAQIEAAGAKTVYMQDIPFGTSDFMPYLTKIKQLNPDVLVINLDSEQSLTVAKQITELGGWGNTKVVGLSQSISAAKLPGAEGWIILTTWAPGLDYPASQKFEQDWKAIIGTVPSGNHVYHYLGALTAVEAIKLAGTDDPVKVNDAIHSGNLQFDTPMGMTHFSTSGESGLKYMYVQIQKGGTTVPFK